MTVRRLVSWFALCSAAGCGAVASSLLPESPAESEFVRELEGLGYTVAFQDLHRSDIFGALGRRYVLENDAQSGQAGGALYTYEYASADSARARAEYAQSFEPAWIFQRGGLVVSYTGAVALRDLTRLLGDPLR